VDVGRGTWKVVLYTLRHCNYSTAISVGVSSMKNKYKYLAGMAAGRNRKRDKKRELKRKRKLGRK
jgi:hypothetical protein